MKNEWKQIQGVAFDKDDHMRMQYFDIRWRKDAMGESLALRDPRTNMVYVIPFESVRLAIEHELKQKESDKSTEYYRTKAGNCPCNGCPEYFNGCGFDCDKYQAWKEAWR